jgi:hypothetical protein
MLSDSQGSTNYSESHGLQKLVPISDFLIGGTGAGDLIRVVNDYLTSDTTINAANIKVRLVEVVDELIRPGVQSELEFVVATEKSLLSYQPGRFKKPTEDEYIAWAGSGGEFVRRAWLRDLYLGIGSPLRTLGDTFVAAEAFLDAANESLTVDDKLMLGIVAGGRTYVTGERDIYPLYAPDPLVNAWNLAAQRFRIIKTLAEQIRSELKNAQRSLSSVKVSGLGSGEIASIEASNLSIGTMRTQLDAELQSYMGWYDGLLGR